MLRKFYNLFVLCPLLLASSFLMADDRLPEEFTVTERWISWTTTFDIETKDRVLGIVHRKLFTWTPEYHLIDTQEKLLAKARMRFFSLLTVFDVEDSQANPLGTVHQQFTFLFPTFKILSPNGQILGVAVLNFWKTTFTISDPVDGHPIAILSRPFFRLKSNWTVQIVDPAAISANRIHPQLFLTLIAFQVDREYWEAARRRYEQNQLDREIEYQYDLYARGSVQEENESEAIPFKEFRAQLETFRVELNGVEPKPLDFQSVEELTEFVNQPSEELDELTLINQHMSELFHLLSSERLNAPQKAALFLMLENKLKQE